LSDPKYGLRNLGDEVQEILRCKVLNQAV
jgi:hypothetical protein